ncbi:unnamed protein product [Parajaminaea phylloscopi]
MASFSTPSRPGGDRSRAHSSAGTPAEQMGGNLSVSGFTPGGPVPAGFSYLERASGAPMRTPTRKGQEAHRRQRGDSGRHLPVSASLDQVDVRKGSRAADRIAAALSSPDIAKTSIPARSPSMRSVRNLPAADAGKVPTIAGLGRQETLGSLNQSLMSLASLPVDARQWTPAHVSTYLAHVLRLVPAPVVEDLSNFVRNERMSGKAFLRLRERDLADKGMNMRWRRLMSEASRRLRRDALRRRIWSGTSDGAKHYEDREDDCEDGGCGAQEELSPGQKRLMTATLKRIRDRRFVQGLVQAIESPKHGEDASLPSGESPVSVGKVSPAHPKQRSDEKTREPIEPPFGDGYVRRQASSFSNLADATKDDTKKAYQQTWRRHRRGDAGSGGESTSSLDVSSETSSSMISSSSNSSVSTCATDMDMADLVDLTADKTWHQPSASPWSSFDSQMEGSTDDDDDDESMDASWDTPLDQSLVDAILASPPEASTLSDDDSGAEPQSPISSSSSFLLHTGSEDKTLARPLDKADQEDFEGTIRGQVGAVEPRSVHSIFDTRPHAQLQQREADHDSATLGAADLLDMPGTTVRLRDLQSKPSMCSAAVSVLDTEGTSRASYFQRADQDDEVSSLLLAPDDLPSNGSVHAGADTRGLEAPVEHASATVLIDTSGGALAAGDITAACEPATECGSGSSSSQQETSADLCEAKEQRQRTLSRASTRAGYAGVLQALSVARDGVAPEVSKEPPVAAEGGAIDYTAQDGNESSDQSCDSGNELDIADEEVPPSTNTQGDRQDELGPQQDASQLSDLPEPGQSETELSVAPADPWSTGHISPDLPLPSSAPQVGPAATSSQELTTTPLGDIWPSTPFDAEFEAVLTHADRGLGGKRPIIWFFSAMHSVGSALSDPLDLIGAAGQAQTTLEQSDLSQRFSPVDESASEAERSSGPDLHKAFFGLPEYWSQIPSYVVGFTAGVAVVVVSEIFLRGAAPRRWR